MSFPAKGLPSVARNVSVQSLGSSSSGNAFLVTTESQVLLIDCGVGIRTIQSALRDRNLSLQDIGTICITHEHSDHIATLPRILRDDITVFATAGTLRQSVRSHPNQIVAEAGKSNRFGDFVIWPLPVQHDATEPTGFMLEFTNGARATILTDLGTYTEDLTPFLQASDLIVLEANYDEDMLTRGSYPAYLKNRVRSKRGHLSNLACGTALARVLREEHRQPTIRLAHRSEQNNTAELAEGTVRELLMREDLELDVVSLPRRTVYDPWFPTDIAASVKPLKTPQASPAQLEFGF